MQDSLEDYIRIARNTKSEPQIKKEVLITAQIKKQCDSKAMQIVQFAIEGRLQPQALFRCLPFITPEHYQDIVEERAITKLCGYPLCARKIPEMPKKQFHIASKSNRVYDITERKNFCSNHCYKASIHIKQQIDNCPLWLRKHDKIPQYTALNKSEKGIPGELIDQGIIRPSPDLPHFTSISDFAQCVLDEAEENELSVEDQQPEQKLAIRKPKKYQKTSMKTICEEEPEEPPPKPNNKPSTPKKIIPNQPPPLTQPTDYSKLLEKCFNDWITLETVIFIHGESKIRSKMQSHKLCEYFAALNLAEMEIEQRKKYTEICRKLKMRELAEEKYDSRIVGNHLLEPVPDYQQLKAESRQMEVKVKSFFNGEVVVKEQQQQKNKNSNNKPVENEENGEESQPAVLPLADVNSQNALRRKIFLNSLNRAMQNLLQQLRINQTAILTDLRGLVKTFKLRADNIVFKPHIWNVITIILLKMLCLKCEEIRENVPEDRFREITKLWMSSVPNHEEFVEKIVGLVGDLDAFLQNYVISCSNESKPQ